MLIGDNFDESELHLSGLALAIFELSDEVEYLLYSPTSDYFC
jgi:hypothetical protein